MSRQYYLKNTIVAFGVPIDDDVEFAWDINKGGGVPSLGGMVVAVIGSGVEAIHPDFGDHVEFGYDATTQTDDTLNCTNCASNPAQAHGTSVAGIIVAEQNTTGMAGIAPDAIVEPIRILDSDGNGTDLAAADGLNFAWATLQAQILNNSWAFRDPSFRSQAVTDAINNATTQGRSGLGAVVVFSAGNTSARGHGLVGPVLYPALLPAAISVSAIDHTGALADYAPHGKVDIVAPSSRFTSDACGVGDLVTADLVGPPGCSDGPSGNVDYTSSFGGTSAAAPQVSAAVALLLTKEQHAHARAGKKPSIRSRQPSRINARCRRRKARHLSHPRKPNHSDNFGCRLRKRAWHVHVDSRCRQWQWHLCLSLGQEHQWGSVRRYGYPHGIIL